MRNHSRRSSFFVRGASFATVLLFTAGGAHAQLSGTVDINTSQKTGDDAECAIARNPANFNQLFLFCNSAGAGLFAANSADGGVTWGYPDPTDKTIADGDPGQGPSACCDPTAAWDSFGNLFITYINASVNTIETILSTDGGNTFTNLVTFAGSVDQPTVVAGAGSVWIVWNQSGQIVARGAPVTGLGAANIGAFTPLQTATGTGGCSFGDIAIGPPPTGVVVQVCGPSSGQLGGNVIVNIDADGLGAGVFGPPIVATTTLVGGFDFIPAQNSRSIDSETGLFFDVRPASPHFGRLYLVYTDETVQENNDTEIMVRFSDNNGANWSSPPIRVNDDPGLPTIRSQFNPKMSFDEVSGNLGVCWHDCRESATNTAMREYCSAAGPTEPSPAFLPNAAIGDGLSTSNGFGVEFGDYSGMDYLNSVLHPGWADTSNSTGNNPNGNSNFDAYTDRVTGVVPVELMNFRIE